MNDARSDTVIVPDRLWRQRFRRVLRRWFERNARDLPWRQSRDLYHVWISEVMLQQTQVSTVIPYYQRFLQQFPSIAVLAAADQRQVLRQWEGLGYYRRARQMHQAAQVIVREHAGEFPTQIGQVLALPGIGRYTAGAILSIALDQPFPILEANTVRLFSRLLSFTGDVSSRDGQQHLWAFAEALLPRRRVGDFNQALMELGATICACRPQCESCPAIKLCPTFAGGLQDQIPRRKVKTQYVDVREAAVVVRCGDKILLRCCQPGERWTGMWDFPRFAVRATRGQRLNRELTENVVQLTGLQVELVKQLTTIRHGVTRFRITLQCHEARCETASTPLPYLRWVQWEDMQSYPLSVTGRKIWTLLDKTA